MYKCMYVTDVSGLWAGKPHAQLTTQLVQLFLHKNQFGMCVVPDPFPPCAGDVIHSVLRLIRGRLTRLVLLMIEAPV